MYVMYFSLKITLITNLGPVDLDQPTATVTHKGLFDNTLTTVSLWENLQQFLM